VSTNEVIRMDSSSGHTIIRWGGGNEEGTKGKEASHLNSVYYCRVATLSFLSPLCYY